MATGNPLNDIRAFDTKTGSWLPVTIQHDDVSPPALPPGEIFLSANGTSNKYS
jgi:hypothetical protein